MMVNLHLGASYIDYLVLTTCNAFVTILESCDLNIHRISLILSAAAAADDALPPEAEVDGRVEAPPVLLLQEIHVT